jgi:hypothetical protein
MIIKKNVDKQMLSETEVRRHNEITRKTTLGCGSEA